MAIPMTDRQGFAALAASAIASFSTG